MIMQSNPHDIVGWAIVVLGVITTATAFVLAVAAMIAPGETEQSHPKFLIFKADR